jgi:spermidine synthase
VMIHGELAAQRPHPRYLTEYYLWLAVGGLLGGIFNGLLAPVAFNSILEYPLIMILASFVRPMAEAPRKSSDKIWDFAGPAFLGISVVVLTRWVIALPEESKNWMRIASILYTVVPILLCFSFRYHRVRFALGLAVYLFSGTFMNVKEIQRLHAERTFFGVHRVNYKVKDKMNTLVHGGTVHGYQNVEPHKRNEPLGYYHHKSPIGQVMDKRGTKSRIGFVGLGAGALASYGKPGDDWTFFEIDPAVQRIAENPEYFTYLKDSRAEYRVVLGDARLSLQKIPDASYDILVIDAFSSDSIPVHLITEEAAALYLQKLRPGGLLAFHISNRYLDLEPVVGGLAERHGLTAYAQFNTPAQDLQSKGYSPSRWVVAARRPEDLAFLDLGEKSPWKPAKSGVFWTDTFSDILSVYKTE